MLDILSTHQIGTIGRRQLGKKPYASRINMPKMANGAMRARKLQGKGTKAVRWLRTIKPSESQQATIDI